MSHYVDLILPLPLRQLYTYEVTFAEYQCIESGMRIIVSFGKKKKYTGIVFCIHDQPPTSYTPKPIDYIIDHQPIIQPTQMKYFEWLSQYYMCPLGLVVKAALPSAMLLESETEVVFQPKEIDINQLSESASILFQFVQEYQRIGFDQIQKLFDRKNPYPIIQELMDLGVVILQEEVYQRYQPKKIKTLSLNDKYQTEEGLDKLLTELSKKTKQREVLMRFINVQKDGQIPLSALKKIKGVSVSSVQTLIKNKVFIISEIEVGRLPSKTIKELPLPVLSDPQQQAHNSIKAQFEKKDIVLLHGVTSSGKTTIYAHMIKNMLSQGKSVLYLIPEIAITTQLIQRLYAYFGQQLAVYHSRYTQNERVEVWQYVLTNNKKARLVIGVRSSIFLPFSNLGLIVVDEAHETAFKQYESSPRYHARDAAIVLAKHHCAKVLLGTATPSLESYYNAKSSKYGLVTLTERYSGVVMPHIDIVDVKEAYRKKKIKGHISNQLHQAIKETLAEGQQVILFQNRRGYASFMECNTCAYVPQCHQCDVSLTQHRHQPGLRCHYCGYEEPIPSHCKACGSPTIDHKGLGTQQIEEEIQVLFPNASIGRMDLDTTRKKNSHATLINDFERRKIDILIGTQMIAKGLDFEHVSLVGVYNADGLLYFPDFRAYERAFQLLVQVAGRPGRSRQQGRVIIQTFSPDHPILYYVHKHDYVAMYDYELKQRNEFFYPPYVRLIRIELRFKNYSTLFEASQWFAKALRANFNQVLGPQPPHVSRIRNQYIQHIQLKLPASQSTVQSKEKLLRIQQSFEHIGAFRAVSVQFDVDPI